MKKTLFGYYRLTADEFSELWRSCVFILDASVLLNLYRYPKEASSDLLKILAGVSDRLWIPHQAALEYQENRLSVIAEQVQIYEEVRKVLNSSWNTLSRGLGNLQLKKRHSQINPDEFLNRVQYAFEEFKARLEELEKKQPDITDDDDLRAEIDSLLKDRVGSPPGSQAELDEMYEEGELRYQQRRPPGYMDMGKASADQKESYLYGGLVFKRKFGDLILWHQIIKEAEMREDFKKIILVIDDKKEDWWWIVKSRGKAIGPRPELIEEISSKAGVPLFHMYTSERFMQFAREYLKVEIKPESIGQLQDVLKSFAELREFLRVGRQEAMRTEKSTVQLAMDSMMIDNGIDTIPNPVSSATAVQDMSAFPDTTSDDDTNGDKRYDPNGNAYTICTGNDKAGYVLYGHDITGDNCATPLVNYMRDATTTYYYTVDADGTVHQYIDAAKTGGELT